MLALVGFVIVVGSVIGGYLMEGGKLLVLFQPAELVIIGGAATGSLLIAAPMKVTKMIISQIMGVLGSPPGKDQYTKLLVMLYEVFQAARKDGLVAMEAHVEKPEESSILKKYPEFLADHHLLNFFVDTMRLILSGGVPAHDLEALIDVDLDAHHEEIAKAPAEVNRIGDSLPGLGIVAAVLGVILTMGAIGGAPEVIGEKVGAALVGTFLGVLLAYGFVSPLAMNMTHMNAVNTQKYSVIKQSLLGFHKGMAPSIAVEFARRSISSDVRPGFVELEDACKATREKG